MTKVLIIDGVTIKKGERKYLEMHIAKLFDNTEMTIPVEVIRGKEDGPTLFISSLNYFSLKELQVSMNLYN